MGYFIKQFDDYRLNFPLDDGEGESEREILQNTIRLMAFIIMTKKEILGKSEDDENLSKILRNGLNHSNDKSYDRLFLRCEKAFPIPSSVSIPESGNCYTLNLIYVKSLSHDVHPLKRPRKSSKLDFRCSIPRKFVRV